MQDDTSLQLAVLAELGWEPSIVAGHVGVTAAAGVVTLSGHVENYAQKHAAELAAQRVGGVLAVADELEVRLPIDAVRSDDSIAAAVLDRLAWDVSVPRDSVKVTVRDGWITLHGEVEWAYQKDAAAQDVRRLHGVTGVSNLTTIRPRVDTRRLGEEIKQALRRSWFSNPDSVNVNAIDGIVYLSGAAHSRGEVDLAVATAWAAPGTVRVDNDIVVS